jgi:hypothetical protein
MIGMNLKENLADWSYFHGFIPACNLEKNLYEKSPRCGHVDVSPSKFDPPLKTDVKVLLDKTTRPKLGHRFGAHQHQ